MKDEALLRSFLETECAVLKEFLDTIDKIPPDALGNKALEPRHIDILEFHYKTLYSFTRNLTRAINYYGTDDKTETFDICDGTKTCWEESTMSKDEKIKALREEVDNWNNKYGQVLEEKKLVERDLRESNNDYNRVNNSYLKALREKDKLSQKNVLISTSYDMLKDKYDRCQTTINALTDANREMVNQIDHIRDALKMDLSCNTKLVLIADIVKIPDPNED